jgi:hypothetical protein
MSERYIPGHIHTTPEAPVVRKVSFPELTLPASKGYAEGKPGFHQGGDIFMAEGSGEVPPIISLDASLGEGAPTAESFYQDLLARMTEQGVPIPIDLRGMIKNTLKEMEAEGEFGNPSIKEVKDPLFSDFAVEQYSTPKLRNIARVVKKVGSEGNIDTGYLDRQIEKVEHMLDEQNVPYGEAAELISQLQGLRKAKANVEVVNRPQSIDATLVKTQSPHEIGSETLFKVAKESFPVLAPIADAISNLSNLAALGQISDEHFKERAKEIRALLNNHEQVFYKPPEGMEEDVAAEKSRSFLEYTGKLSSSIGEIYKRHFAKTELRADEDRYAKAIEAAEVSMRPLREAYRILDRLVEIPADRRTVEQNKEYEDAYDAIEAVINKIDFADQGASTLFEVIIQESLYTEGEMLNLKKEPMPDLDPAKSREGKEHYGYALEYAVERIIGQGDLNPTSDYPQFGFYQNNNLDELIQGARKYNEGFYIYLLNLRGKRQLLHDLFKNLKDRNTLVGIVSKALDPGSMRFIEEQIAGTTDSQALFEKEYGRVAARTAMDKKGWVLFEQYRDEIDVHVENTIKNNKVGLQRTALKWKKNDKTKRWDATPELTQTRKMREWELSRAFNMGRALTGAMLRRQIYSSYGDAPADIPELVTSLEGGEEINMILAPLARIAARYFGQTGATIFLEEYVKRMVATGGGRGADMRYSFSKQKADGTIEKFGIYGASERATVLLDTGAIDIKSSGWRAARILRQTEWGVAGTGYSLDEYLAQKKTHIREELERTEQFKAMHDPNVPLHERLALKHHLNHDVSHHFHDDLEVARVLSKQRLFLGIIARRGDLSEGQKNVVWKNVARLLPSRIASLMPQFTMDEVVEVYGGSRDDEATKAIWDKVHRKLQIVEHNRVQEDIRGLRLKPDGTETDSSVRDRDLAYYIEKYNESVPKDEQFDERDKEVVRRWQALGVNMSTQLAHVVWPHTPFLDDVPQSGFKHWGRNEFDRLLINDHNDWQAAYGPIVGLIANPATTHPEEVEKALFETFHEFVAKATSPESLEDAQRRVEGFVYAWSEMAKKFPSAKYTFDLASWVRQPTSKMEMFNLSSGISFDEERMAKFILKLGKMEVLSDDPYEKDKKGRTQTWRMLKELDADTMARFLMYVRFMLLLFPAEFVQALIGGIIPEELAKAA